MSFQEELEKILTDLVKQNGAELMHERLKHPSIEKALTSIINLVDKEVIGADEEENKFAITNPLWEARQTFKFSRDNLRDEQRAIIRGGDE